jgi:hypothetical protein
MSDHLGLQPELRRDGDPLHNGLQPLCGLSPNQAEMSLVSIN